MKKKGLIISTVVMVVVLLASLTTATYAWFSQSAAASIGNIELNVSAATNVNIGIAKVALDDDEAIKSSASYVNEDVTYTDAGFWTGKDGLGTFVNTGLSMAVSAAVGSGTQSGDDWTMDPDYNKANTLCTGSGIDVTKLSNVAPAAINGKKGATIEKTTDVVDLDLGVGVKSSKEDGSTSMTSMYGKITILPNGTYIGMAAALKFEISVNGTVVYEGDIFGEVNKKWDTTTQGAEVFWFEIAKADTGTLTNEIKNVEIRFFVDGYDTDCCNKAAALGTGATITLEFDAYGADSTPDMSGWKQLKKA